MKEAIKFSEFKEKSAAAFEVPLWSAIHFQDEVKKKEMTVTPAEQLRYEQNANFAEAVTKELEWLIDAGNVDENIIEKKIQSLKNSLTPAQATVLKRVKERILKAHAESSKMDQDKAEKMYDQMVKERNFPIADSLRISPLGAIIVQSSNWPLKMLEAGGFTYEPTENDKASMDPQIYNFLQRLIVIRNSPDESNKPTQEEIRRHETFHYLYNLAIRPENATTYKFDLEKRYFLQAKNEMLAYLLIGRWPWNAKDLLSDLKPRQKRITDFDDRTNDDVLLQVYQNVCKEVGSNVYAEEYTKETEGYPDEMYLALREMARLYCIESKAFDQAVKAILASQDFREMAYNLKKIEGDKLLSWKDSLPDILKLTPAECRHRLINLATLQRDFRLRFKMYDKETNHADWEYFYGQVADYIRALKKEPDDEEKSIAASELSNLLRSFGVEIQN